MKATLWILMILNTEGQYVPESLHQNETACDDKSYVIFEQFETMSECHAMETRAVVQCTTDSNCIDFHYGGVIPD